jgi:putative PIG3 family NAD(P)H quinone oxidoreductase
MRASVIGKAGSLALQAVERPSPERGEVLVRVRASGVNRADLLQRRGLYPAPPGWPAHIPGLEVAGEVDAVGPGVSLWQPGQAVMAVVGGGGYDEYVRIHERELVRAPAGLSAEEAGAIPEVFWTAWDALFERLSLRPGETVLIHAVGSGVGTAAMQLARDAGVHVVGTSRTPAKLERARHLGLDVPILAGDDWVERVLAEVGEVDCILDLVGGPYLAGNLRCLRPLGRLAEVGLTGGLSAELDLGLLLKKRITVVGTALRSRPLEEKATLARMVERRLLPRFEAGALRPVVDRVFPVAEAEAAHDYVQSNAPFGKVVLSW